MAETAATPKRKLGEILRVLEKGLGKVHVLPDESPLDQVVYLILRENWDYRKAVRSLHVLQKEFVDWNEVRVTTAGELRGALLSQGDRDLDVKIEKLRTLLENIYRERNCAHLNFLSEMDAEEQRRFLSAMGVLRPSQVQLLVQCLAGPDEVLVPQQAIRVLSRIGLMPRVHSSSSALKHLEKLLEPEDLFTFQSHLVHHGEEICLSKSPRCGECSLVPLCAFKRKVGVS
jgi:endonuclease-3